MSMPATTWWGDSVIENRTYEEIAVGDQASLTRLLTVEDIQLFALVSGDMNPAHLDADYAAESRFHHVIAHGMWSGALISALLGTRLPGPGTIYLGQSLSFTAPVSLGDSVTVSVTVVEKTDAHRHLRLACRGVNQDGVEVVTGEALVMAPRDKVRRPAPDLPAVYLRHRGIDRLVFDNAAFMLSLAPYRPVAE